MRDTSVVTTDKRFPKKTPPEQNTRCRLLACGGTVEKLIPPHRVLMRPIKRKYVYFSVLNDSRQF